jgi:hypothetical protein
VHYSVQGDHLHLIVEAAGRDELMGGARGLSVSLARRINRLTFRRGALFADRWHGRALSSPRAVRHAIVYVLGNFRKHGERCGSVVDPYSSAVYFAGFVECDGLPPLLGDSFLVPAESRARDSPVAEPESWLLRRGWLQSGSISIYDGPAASREKHATPR